MSTPAHEPLAELSAAQRERRRILRTIIEEFDAVDLYWQRAALSSDPAAAAMYMHNRDEELEHAAMALEWLRRNDPVAERHFKRFLFSEGSIVGVEENEDETVAAGRGLI